MRAHHTGHEQRQAAPNAASSDGAAGAAPLVADAVAPAGLNTEMELAPAAQAPQSRVQNEPRDPATDHKAFFTLRAPLALNGHGLSRTNGDDGQVRFYVTRWPLVCELPDISAVSDFAEQVGAKNA
jgi:hypothetical protein